MARDRQIINATIASGTSASAEVNVGAKRIVGIIMPAAWDAAGIAFQALVAEPSALPKVPVYGNVVDQGHTAVAITTPGAGEYVAIADTQALIALGRIKVISGTNALPVNQTAQRVVGLVCVDV